MTPFIRIQNISKKFGKLLAVDDVSFNLERGELFSLLGPSGCGKTTLLRMLAGFEKPSEGYIEIDGQDMANVDPADRPVNIMFQSYALYPNMNVYENIRFPLKVRGTDPKLHDAKVRRASAMVELDEFLHRKPAELSGGQRQRVALGRAIVREPNLFLMDEPLSNLDAKLRVSTRAQIKNLSHELKVTTIYVTHDQIEAMTLADRVVVMKEGVVQQVGSPTEIYDRPANAFVASFIGNPAMNLIEGQVSNGVFSAEHTQIEVGEVPNGPVTLGFRAEDALVVEVDGNITAPIYTQELLGDATMVSVRLSGALVAVKADKNYRAAIEDEVSFRIPSELCHLFDAQTGARIGG